MAPRDVIPLEPGTGAPDGDPARLRALLDLLHDYFVDAGQGEAPAAYDAAGAEGGGAEVLAASIHEHLLLAESLPVGRRANLNARLHEGGFAKLFALCLCRRARTEQALKAGHITDRETYREAETVLALSPGTNQHLDLDRLRALLGAYEGPRPDRTRRG